MADTAFQFDDVVRVRVTPETRSQGIAGKVGVVVGISESDWAGEPPMYALGERDFAELYMVDEADLEATGEIETPDDRPRTSIRVSEQGELLMLGPEAPDGDEQDDCPPRA